MIGQLRHLHVLMKQWTSESDGALLGAWQLIGQELHKFIEATHCVTTAPEEFEAMNHVLLVPLQLIFTESHDSSPSSQNTAHEDKYLVALWSKLCASYVRIAAVKSQHANNAIYTLANTLTTLFHSRIVASSRGCVVLTRCITALIQSVTMPLHTQPQMGKFWRNDPTQEAQYALYRLAWYTALTLIVQQGHSAARSRRLRVGRWSAARRSALGRGCQFRHRTARGVRSLYDSQRVRHQARGSARASHNHAV